MAKTKQLTGADRRWGYEYGCDGTVSAEEAAKILNVTYQTIWKLGKDGKIRRGKRPGQRVYDYCVRSIEQYKVPVEC